MPCLVAVTGSSGVLGRGIVDCLVEYGAQVLAFTSSRQLLSDGGSRSSISYVPRNDLSVLEEREIDCLVNCAFPRQDNGGAVASGLRYSAQLFHACSHGSVRSIINISSQSVYSQKRSGVATEKENPSPEGGYAIGKYAAEVLCDFLARSIPHSHIRLASLIGADYPQRFINYFANRVIEEKPLVVRGGDLRYGFMDVKDASEAVATMALTDPLRWASVYNLGPSAQGYSMDEIVGTIIAAARRRGYSPEIRSGEQGAIHNSTLDSSLFELDFNWRSKRRLEETVEDIFDHLLVSGD